ncbi:MAG: hypothetical protein ABIK18_00975 [candidate division WOR-3 bacterium]
MVTNRHLSISLLFAGIALASPTMRVGTKLTYHSGYGTGTYSDTTGKPVAQVSYGEPFVGPTVEACYGPIGWFSGRVDLMQLAFFTTGGAAFKIFPMLGLDILAEPPLSWRLKPYIWAGMRLVSYGGLPETEPPTYHHDSEVHYRAGLGLKFLLNPKVEIFAETQLFSHDLWWDGVIVLAGLRNGHFAGLETCGFNSAELGARFLIGR